MSAVETDRLIERFAAAQRDRVARWQLLGAGADAQTIGRRVRSGALRAVMPGVYATGSAPADPRQALIEAWLYGGEGAVLSRRGGARFWTLGHFESIDVVARTHRAGFGCVSFHRAQLAEDEWIERDGIAVTTPARTLLDLAAIVPARRLRVLYTEAEVLGRVDQPAVARTLARHPAARGSRTLARLAGLDAGWRRRGRIRSRLEIRYRSLVESTDLDWPDYNFRIELGDRVYVIDAFHPRSRIAIELDGGNAHGAQARFNSDRERDRRMLVAGIQTVRLTDEHFSRPAELYRDLVVLVGRRHDRLDAAA